jgi:hypothetical protein
MTSMRKYAGSSFIGLDDVVARPLRAVIIEVIPEGNFDKPELLLDSGQRFSVNVTNVKALIAAFGDEHTDWLGKRIELFAGFIKYQGAERESVLVRAISPAKKAAPHDEMSDEVPF